MATGEIEKMTLPEHHGDNSFLDNKKSVNNSRLFTFLEDKTLNIIIVYNGIFSHLSSY